MVQLYASVLMKDPVTVCKAKSILEKALAQDEMYLPAVYLLAEIYEQVSYSLQTYYYFWYLLKHSVRYG
jgi:Tfp pilus assembly protein PilF